MEIGMERKGDSVEQENRINWIVGMADPERQWMGSPEIKDVELCLPQVVRSALFVHVKREML